MTTHANGANSARKISRQRLYQLRRQAEGKCTICGKLRDGDSVVFCKEHAQERLDWAREKRAGRRGGRSRWKR